MNERIKLLAEQAGILKEQTVKAKIVKNEDGTWTSILEYPDLEKFAELIVKECVKLQHRNVIVGGGVSAYNMGSRHLAEDILKHFGVEE